ncbi:MAG: type IV pilus assembly protein PilM [Candidatus Nealsonbacteria bacterium]|nr:type IV pilus assembly protein PilM [Candidatus Nealsonbacteria bacterium]
MRFFGLLPQKSVGIDIGTSSIKLVELSTWAGRKKLENYGEIYASVFYKKQFRTFEKNTLLLSDKDVSKAVKAVMLEAGIESKGVCFSIPDFSTFFTTFELPPMSQEEIPQAVKMEARQHIPLPLGEVTIDWQVLTKNTKKSNVKILLAAVPNEVINQYQAIANHLDLEMIALEAEVFALKRALVGREEEKAVALIDIGARSTSCSIVDDGTLEISRSFDMGGDSLVERISKGLSVSYEEADKLKKRYGILPAKNNSQENEVGRIISPLVDLILREIERVCTDFSIKKRKEVEKMVLCGGNALIPGIREHFKDYFKNKEIKVADPFEPLYYPPILEGTLDKMGPSYSVAVGMALRGLR